MMKAPSLTEARWCLLFGKADCNERVDDVKGPAFPTGLQAIQVMICIKPRFSLKLV